MESRGGEMRHCGIRTDTEITQRTIASSEIEAVSKTTRSVSTVGGTPQNTPA
jgi:hypothetical protein